MMPEMGHTVPRLGFKMRARPDGDRMSMNSPDFVKIMGKPWVSKMAPFLLANRGRVLPKLRVNKGPLEDGRK